LIPNGTQFSKQYRWFAVDEEVANFQRRCADQRRFPNKENYDLRAVYTRTAKTPAVFVADFSRWRMGQIAVSRVPKKDASRTA